MRSGAFAAVALAGISALGLLAAKQPAPPTTFDPEIGYTYASGNYMDLRLANRAGSAAILVHRSAFGAIAGFDLAPERPEAGAANRIAFIDRGDLYLKTWTKNPVAVSATAQSLYNGVGPVETLDFSPDGTRLIFNTLGDVSEIIIHNLEPGVDESVQRVLTADYNVLKVRWDDTGDRAFFVGSPKSSTQPALALHTIDMDGNVTKLLDVAAAAMEIDVTRPPGGAGSRIVHSNAGALNLLTFAGAFDRKAANGYLAHFNCNNTAIIHRGTDRKRSTIITSLVAGVAPQTWSSDSNIHHTDWLQRSTCGA